MPKEMDEEGFSRMIDTIKYMHIDAVRVSVSSCVCVCVCEWVCNENEVELRRREEDRK